MKEMKLEPNVNPLSLTNCFSNTNFTIAAVKPPQLRHTPVFHVLKMKKAASLSHPMKTHAITADEGVAGKWEVSRSGDESRPLLQNLLLAGALPHWRRPPPPMDTFREDVGWHTGAQDSRRNLWFKKSKRKENEFSLLSKSEVRGCYMIIQKDVKLV
ncbi:hypothetical protein L1987_45424 [Smallanthus sonchifolius]|uniref:Uncharacterized protein n=1 Tax=Smallanthus sonchifolius TaxID=185202 RepID=A0ACB9FXW6_9ASTR|nr:hypothetical protein L1987_45424 [Smallanthus sonchifolius]